MDVISMWLSFKILKEYYLQLMKFLMERFDCKHLESCRIQLKKKIKKI